MGRKKNLDPVLEVLRVVNTIPKGVQEYQARETEFLRRDELIEKAVSLVFKPAGPDEPRNLLRARLQGVVDMHLERLEEEARLGSYSEISAALWAIEGAASHLVGLFEHSPLAALDRLRAVAREEARQGRSVRAVEEGDCDWLLGSEREIYDLRPSGSSHGPTGLVGRLAALGEFARCAAKRAEEESGAPYALGAQSVRHAQTGRTLDQNLFQDCTCILGPIPRGLARLRAVARLLKEAATGTAASEGWGRDHEKRARAWWRAVGAQVRSPLSQVPAEKREVLEEGLQAIKLPDRRGKKTDRPQQVVKAPRRKGNTTLRGK